MPVAIMYKLQKKIEEEGFRLFIMSNMCLFGDKRNVTDIYGRVRLNFELVREFLFLAIVYKFRVNQNKDKSNFTLKGI